MQVYHGFPQLLFTRSLTCEKALGSSMFCEEGKRGALKAAGKSACLLLSALLLLRNKLPKIAGRSNRDLKLTAGTRAAAEAGEKGRHLASSACWGCASFPSAPCSVLTEGLGTCCCAWDWCVTPLVCHPPGLSPLCCVTPLSPCHPLCLPSS